MVYSSLDQLPLDVSGHMGRGRNVYAGFCNEYLFLETYLHLLVFLISLNLDAT